MMTWNYAIRLSQGVRSTKSVDEENVVYSIHFTMILLVSGAFYYHLGNLSLCFRSKIYNIQLLLLAKTSTVSEFGIDRILEPAVEDIRKLQLVTRLSCKYVLKEWTLCTCMFICVHMYMYMYVHSCYAVIWWIYAGLWCSFCCWWNNPTFLRNYYHCVSW